MAGRFEEAVRIIVPLVREGKVDLRGEYYSAPDCEIRPRGPRPAGPPVLVASFGPRMLRLTARYADSWNSAWFGRPTLLAERRAKLEAACAEVGRDPATLEVTAGVLVAYPDAGEVSAPLDNPDKILAGSAEEVAAGLRAYEELSVGHVICSLMPNNAAALTRFAEALRLYRGRQAGS